MILISRYDKCLDASESTHVWGSDRVHIPSDASSRAQAERLKSLLEVGIVSLVEEALRDEGVAVTKVYRVVSS